MDKEEKNLNQFPTILRYLLGIFLFFSPFIICFVRKLDVMLVFLGLLTPPLTFMFLPPLATGVYFIVSKKWHWRGDIFLILISIIAEIFIALSSFNNG